MKCYSPINIQTPGQNDSKNRTLVPCGRCSACLVNYRNEWIIRIKEEMKDHKFGSFLTLTYSDDNVVYGAFFETLSKDHLQGFMKRLRERLKFKIRFYALGEYGGKTKRPHYHCIIFGLNFNDRIHVKHAKEAWDKGFVTVTPVTGRRIGYICKYHLNKGRYPEGSSPPFVLMSNKPGLGASYVSRMKEFHERGIDFAYHSDRGVKQALPRYYRNKLYSKAEREEMAERLKDEFALDVIEKYNNDHPNSNYFKSRSDHYNALKLRYEKMRNLNNKL